MLASHDRTNFDTLCRAFESGHVALLEIERRSDRAPVAAICAVGYESGEFLLTPFATMVEGNPCDLFNPPNPYGGFFGEAGHEL